MVHRRSSTFNRLLTSVLPTALVASALLIRSRAKGDDVADNPDMDILQYSEERSTRTIAVLRASYDDLHERAYKFATVLVGGGGAAAIYVLGKLTGPSVELVSWFPVAALALSWFVTAAILIWTGATSRALSPGNGPMTLVDYYDARLSITKDPDEALETTRRQELRLEQSRIDVYELACTARAKAIDRAYKTAAWITPVVPAVAFLICYRCF